MTSEFNAGSALLSRAIQLESSKRLTESLVCYQEGLKLLMDYMKIAPSKDKIAIKERIDHFMSRAEAIKDKIHKDMKSSTYHEEIVIPNDGTGFGYESVFGRFIKEDIKDVKIEDPYISQNHQLNNFLRLCEMLVKKCPHLTSVTLVTKVTDDSKQKQFFSIMNSNFRALAIAFKVVNSQTLHDRQISLSNGWVIKMGRGLDYFKAVDYNAFGAFDMDLRKCHQTKVDIYFSKNLIN